MKKLNLFYFGIIFLFFILLSCGEEGSQFGELRISLGFQKSPLALSNVTGFKIKVYNSIPSSLDKKAYFDPGCLDYGGDTIVINNIPVGKGKVLVFEGYAEVMKKGGGALECINLSYFGLRGGVEISKQAEEGKYYFIPVYRIDSFTPYPLPNKKIQEKAKSTFCESNLDCQKIHPAATCDTKKNLCSYLTTLFPLNSKTFRTFHSATSFSFENGEIFILGGYNVKKGSSGTGLNFTVDNPPIESFNSSTSLFSTIEIPNLTLQHSYHSSLKWNENTIVLIGGAQMIRQNKKKGDAFLFSLGKQFCNEDKQCEDNLLMLSTIIDFKKRRVVKDFIPQPLAGALTTKVRGNDNSSKLLIVGGITIDKEKKIGTTNKSFTCDINDSLNLSCPETKSLLLNVPRAFHTGTCIKDGEKGCEEFLIFGGKDVPADKIAEIYKYDSSKFQILEPKGEVKNIYLNEIVNVGAHIFSFGGVSGSSEIPDVPPLEIVVDSENKVFDIKEINIPEISTNPSPFYRIFHKLTLLPPDKILITGGINKNGEVEGKALIFAYIDNKFQFVKSVDMSQPRIMHSATFIEGGLLKGGVLVVGGLTFEAGNTLTFAEGAELYYPRTE